MTPLTVTSVSAIAVCLTVLLLRVDADATSSRSGDVIPSGSDLKDSVESRLKPLMRYAYKVPRGEARRAHGHQLWRALADHQVDCRKWQTIYRRRPMGESTSEVQASFARLANFLRDLCEDLGVYQQSARSSSSRVARIVDGVREAKRYDPTSFDEYTDDSESWGALDHGDEVYGGDIGSPKGSWRQNVMRVWGK